MRNGSTTHSLPTTHLPLQTTIAILGLGLIGSSIARALYEHCTIFAFDCNNAALIYASESGFIHQSFATAKEAVEKADIVILAVPPAALPDLVRTISSALKPGTVVTDVASVKSPAIAAISAALPDNVNFVPGHPIAGNNSSGVNAGDKQLFQGKKVILTPVENEVQSPHVERIKQLWEKTGASIYFMPAEIHDLIYAYVSHLPQMIAFAAAPLLATDFLSEEYQRFLRLTASPAYLWVEIALANNAFLLEALDDFIAFCVQMKNELSEKTTNSDVLSQERLSLLTAALFSNCLAATASLLEDKLGADPRFYAGGGFMDMTALAAHNPEDVMGEISQHSPIVAARLKDFLERIYAIRHSIAAQNSNHLLEAFT